MLVQFETEFLRIATAISAGYTTKEVPELQKHLQNYTFAEPLINFIPMENFNSNIGASSQMIYDGRCVLQFITKASKADNLEAVKDVLIDEMILLSEQFFRELNKNENRIFNTPQFKMNSKILRQYTSQYCVGVETTITFETACNRLT